MTAHLTCAVDAPIVDRVVYDASSDPNDLLGRPGGYTSRSDLIDARADSDEFGIEGGIAVESFADADAAADRAGYLDETIEAMPFLAEYHWQEGPILLRVSAALTPEQAEEYRAALDTLPANGPVDACTMGDGAGGAATLPDTPQARSVVVTAGQVPEVPPTSDVDVALVGPASRSSIPVVVFNGSDVPVSGIRVSARIVDSEGATVVSGATQQVLPNVVPSDTYAVGYVFGGGEALPPGSELSDVQVDFTEGIEDFENQVSLDIADVEIIDDRIVGSIVNPTTTDVQGPISVQAACFDPDGQLLSVPRGFADRDELDASESSTFTLNSREPCDGVVIAANGYTAL